MIFTFGLRAFKANPTPASVPPVPTEKAFVAQQRNWVEACRDEEVLLSRPEDAYRVHRILDAAYRSAARDGAQLTL